MPLNVIIGDVPYTVDEEQMPYFIALSSFKSQQNASSSSGDGAEALVHAPIPLFDVALRIVTDGVHTAFGDAGLGLDMKKWDELCETLDFLAVDILGGKTAGQVILNVKNTPSGEKACVGAFMFLFAMMRGRLDVTDHKVANTVYHTVEYIVSHTRRYPQNVRQVLEAAYRYKFTPTRNQLSKLEKARSELESDEDDCCYYSSDEY